MHFVYKSHACQLYGFAWGVASDPESRPMWGHTWLSLFIGYVQLICFLTFFHLSPEYLLPWINVLDFGWLEFVKWLWHRIITKQSFLSYEMIFRNLPVYTNCVLVELLEWKWQFMQCDPPSFRIIQRVYFLLMQPMSLTLWTAIWFIIICQIYPSFAPILIKLIDLLLYTLQVTCCFLKRAPPRGRHCLVDVCSWYNTSDWMLAYWCHLHRCGMLWCLCVWFHFSITSWSVVAAYQVISTGQHNTIQHSMVQHQTIQHNTT